MTYGDTSLAGIVPTLVAGMGWGDARFAWFLVKTGKVKQDRCMPELAWMFSGKFVCKSLKNVLGR
ncbi:hypothetical protein B7486_08865 [cyanobacterium TDX16]|nr:hypothetical protein B7486_08865 [cyanobacterium TDX16]